MSEPGASTQPILHVVSPMWPSPELPHTGIFVQNLSRALEAEGFEVDHVALIRGKGQGPLGKVRVHAGLGAGLASSAIRPADVLYVHAPSWFAPLVTAAALPRHKRIVVHLHGGEVFPHSRMERAAMPWVRDLCQRADLLVSPSHYYAGEVMRAFDIPEDRLFVSPSGGVNTDIFRPGSRDEARDALDLPQDATVIGYVGRIEDAKGWDLIVDVLRLLRQRGRNAVGLVVGAGGAAEALLRSAETLDVPLVHRGLVPQSELTAVYRAMDVFFFPTRGAESLGLVPIEAMACGVPVVGSNRFAVPEYVRPGQTGYLAPPRDVLGFARGAEAILDAPADARAEMALACRAMAETYDARRSAAQLAARIREVL